MNKKWLGIIVSFSTFVVVLVSIWVQQVQKNKAHERTDQLIEKAIDEKIETLPKTRELKPEGNSSQRQNPQEEKINKYLVSVKKVIDLERKVLRSVQENLYLEKSLADQKLISQSFDFLNDKSLIEAQGLENNQKLRMEAALFLTRSIEWQANPKLNWILDKSKNFIVADNLSEIKDLKVRRSFAADKIELFANLKDIYFTTGIQIEEENKSETNAKLFRFANNFYKLNKGEF
jgi:hypothetical protein